MNNDFKQQLQDREFAKLKDEPRVILKWATGCGKSKMTIDLINHSIDPIRTGKLKHKVLFLVAERAHINNWEDEFNKWHLNRSNICTDVCCYASLKKYKDFHYDIVVLDEAHHVFSEKRLAALEEVKNNLMPNAHIYLLSATLSSSKTDTIEEMFGKFTISTVTLKDAISNDILPDPKVYVIGMELNDMIPDKIIKIGKDPSTLKVRWDNRHKYILKNIPCNIVCTEKQKYVYYTDTMERWKNRYQLSKNQYHHNIWVNTGSQRKRYLGELKTEAVYRLLSSIPKSKRYVCFCASVAQAESLSARGTISSKKSAKYNQSVIDAFNQRRTNSIYAIGMITEGMNLTNIELGIIVQLDGKERLFIQKFGRVLRADSPVICIFYYKDTQDEVYLRNALENIDPKYVRHINVNQLKTIKL